MLHTCGGLFGEGDDRVKQGVENALNGADGGISIEEMEGVIRICVSFKEEGRIKHGVENTLNGAEGEVLRLVGVGMLYGGGLTIELIGGRVRCGVENTL